MLPIPSDHLIDPRLGHVGFWSPSFPQGWEAEHRLAEIGGYYRINRRWAHLDLGMAPLRIPCVPLRGLYPELIARIGAASAANMGWTVDA